MASLSHPAGGSDPGPCEVTVLIVSDYASGGDKSWGDLRRALGGLADQDFEGPHEVILVESPRCLPFLPPDLPALLPGLKVVSGESEASYELKNDAVRHARSDLVMVLDADNVPHRSWITAGVAAMGRHPEAVAISGRSTYQGGSTVEKILGLLSRSYSDIGREAGLRCLQRTT